MNTTFEDRLLNELKSEVELRAAEGGPGPSAARRVTTPRRVGVALATCGVAAAVLVAMPGAGSTPAYAVEKHPDGTVTLTLDNLILSGPEQQDLVRKLEKAGVNTQVNQVPKDMRCADPKAELLGMMTGIDPSAVDDSKGPQTEKVKAEDYASATGAKEPEAPTKWKQTLHQGDTLRIDNFAAEGAHPAAFNYFIHQGKISPCELVPST